MTIITDGTEAQAARRAFDLAASPSGGYAPRCCRRLQRPVRTTADGRINYNLLFRWIVGLGIDDAVWDHSTFSKNRGRLLGADVAAKFLAAVLRHAELGRVPINRDCRRSLGLAKDLPGSLWHV